MTKNIMIQGTASSVGKSIITAGLCRIFAQEGVRVAPFKSQNMALNSFATNEGLEMGRAQVVQAQAARIEPSVLMNPILLKPTADKEAQVIIKGRVHANMNAAAYHAFKSKVKDIVHETYQDLAKKYDLIIIEGAGSPAEINLRENDIVNMGMAELADAPVLLVADIDKGGVFASLVGTIQLLNEAEKKRVKGLVINKFRGDIELLKPGIKMLEDIVHVPVLGVIPYVKINLEDEDSVTERFKLEKSGQHDIEINIIKLPYLSNFSDFDIFDLFPDVKVNYVESADQIIDPDIVIIPGSKNTIPDLLHLRNNGIEQKIKALHAKGTLIIGICAGYQMLGTLIKDPYNVESPLSEIAGMGLIEMSTTMAREKTTLQVTGQICTKHGFLNGLQGSQVSGYEIHMGESILKEENYSLLKIRFSNSGYYKENVLGTYLHGIFDALHFSRALINELRARKGLEPVTQTQSYAEIKEAEFDRLADLLRENLDIIKIKEIIKEWNS